MRYVWEKNRASGYTTPIFTGPCSTVTRFRPNFSPTSRFRRFTPPWWRRCRTKSFQRIGSMNRLNRRSKRFWNRSVRYVLKSWIIPPPGQEDLPTFLFVTTVMSVVTSNVTPNGSLKKDKRRPVFDVPTVNTHLPASLFLFHHPYHKTAHTWWTTIL